MFLRIGAVLLCLDLLLGAAHLLWPEYRWGQDRQSYFNLGNSLTLASWAAAMQLLASAVLAMISFHRQCGSLAPGEERPGRWRWAALAACLLVLSFGEITRLHERLDLLGPNRDAYRGMLVHGATVIAMVLAGWFVVAQARGRPLARLCAIGWLVLWGLQPLRAALGAFDADLFGRWPELYRALAGGLAYLCGCTLLLSAVGDLAVAGSVRAAAGADRGALQEASTLPAGGRRWLIFLGVGAMTFTIIVLQIVLFQVLNIFGDYMTATSVISIALLGIAVGGLIGARGAATAPAAVTIGAALILPVSILLAFGAVVRLTTAQPLLASLILTVPFACASAVISVALAVARSHVVYGIDLLGAAVGALAVGPVLTSLREEGALLALAAGTCAAAVCFIAGWPGPRRRWLLAALAAAGGAGLALLAADNLRSDKLNIVRSKIRETYPRARVMFSRSSFVGRYDVIRRLPTHTSLATYENGRIIDNIRRRPVEGYRIDPRVPHTLMDDMDILILGLSGDGITKTARALGRRVYGVEINPAVVALQTGPLVPHNADSYANIDVAVMDGRTYVEQASRQFDMITLLNAHAARGRTTGRAPSPEYLHTREAMASYLDKLTDRGVVNIEEPVSNARREAPVWKLLVTMRQALIDRGSDQPEQHFFVFQWTTRTNNYIQILMKKTAFTPADIASLKRWLNEVDEREQIERRTGQELGPIICKCTILYSPDEVRQTNCDRVLRGRSDERFHAARNLCVTTDDRPFHFDVEPARPEFLTGYRRTLILGLLLMPVLLGGMRSARGDIGRAVPYALIVILTGLGYLLIEVVLIQRYEMLLGSPVVTLCTVLGTMLLASGAGSLCCGRIGRRGLYASLALTIALLALHEWLIMGLLLHGVTLSLFTRAAAGALAIAPLAFLMGVPLPFVLNLAKVRMAPAAAGLLFGINAAASALAVPLCLNISAACGFHKVFEVGMILYALVGLLVVALHRPVLQWMSCAVSAAVVALVLAAPWLLVRSPPPAGLGGPDAHRLYALEYGVSNRAESQILEGGSSRQRPFAWYFFAARGGGRTVLIDTGFDDRAAARDWRIREYRSPVTRLRELGIAPLDVTDIVLTHAHWDHMGALAEYRNATIWMQEAEFHHAVAAVSPSVEEDSGVRWKDVRELLAADREGRLRLLQGEQEVIPGITVTPGGAHTPGFQYVTVRTLDGDVVVAGDASCMHQNSQWHIPISSCSDTAANLEAIRQMHVRAASPFFIIPGHDPFVLAQFPEVAPGITQITAVPESHP